jgi:anti-anti-sigma regulatory factor
MSAPASLRAGEHWLDPQVLLLGTLDPADAEQLAGRVAAAAGARWVVVDVAGVAGPAEAVAPLVAAARAAHARGAELVVTGAAADVAARLDASGLVQLASVDEVVMLLKEARPRTGRARREPVAAAMLPPLDPPWPIAHCRPMGRR